MGYLTDASYKQAQAEVYGQLTTSAVATGSQLVAFSGFSNSNYVREMYSADLDFGTGEWTASAWVNVPVTLPLSSFPLGSEIITNSDDREFSSDTGFWTKGPSITISGGAITWNNIGDGFKRDSILLPGKVYEVTFSITNFPSGSGVRVWVGSTAGAIRSAVGTYTERFSVTGTNPVHVGIYSTATSNCSVDSISVKEVISAAIADRSFSNGQSISFSVDVVGRLTATAFDGITTRTVTTDAAYNTGTWLKVRANYQAGKLAILVNGVEVKSTVGAPLLSLNSRYNLLTYSEQFDNAAWAKNSVTVSANITTAPTGTLTADTLTATSNYPYVSQDVAAVSSTTYSARCSIAKTAGLADGSFPTVSIEFRSQSASLGEYGVVVNTNTGQVVSASGWGTAGFASATVESDGAFWTIKASTPSAPASTTLARVYIGVSGGFADGTRRITSFPLTSIVVWGAQLETGSTAKTYQRVGAASDFDFKAPLTIGNNYAANAPFPGSIALLKFSATVPSTEQSIWMYEQEKQMFREGAQVALPDANAIQDLAYDDLTDRWIAISTTNKSTWSGLVRTASEAVPAGSYTKTSVASGIELVARSTTNPGVDVKIPAYNVKARAKKKAEKSKKLTNATAIYDFTPVVFSNATLTNGSNVMTVTTANTSGTPYIGMGVTGTGIAAGTTIVGIVSGTPNSYYLSAAYTGTTGSTYTVGQSTFSLPVGYTARLVYSGGLIQREGSTKAFTRAFDGFRETIVFGTSPGTSVVQIHAAKQ